MGRQVKRIKEDRFLGWGCSECDWRFDDYRPARGKTIPEMMENFEADRDEAFRAHVCRDHLAKKTSKS